MWLLLEQMWWHSALQLAMLLVNIIIMVKIIQLLAVVRKGYEDEE